MTLFFPQTAAMMIELHGDLLRIISLMRKTSEIFLFLVNLPTISLAWGKSQGSYREWVLYNEKRNRSSSLPSCWFLYWNQFKKILIVAKLVVELYIWLLLYVFFKYSVILYRFADFQIEMLKQFPQKAYIPLFHDYCAKKEVSKVWTTDALLYPSQTEIHWTNGYLLRIPTLLNHFTENLFNNGVYMRVLI